jgi:hypothetical protein
MCSSTRPAGINQSIRASIEVSNLQLSYRPGNKVHGVVKRIKIDNATETVAVVIKLIVRVQTQVTVKKQVGQTRMTSRYLGQRMLYDMRQQLYNGPVAPGINTWPFTFTVPGQLLAPNSLTNLPQPLYSIFHRRDEPLRKIGATRDYLYVEYRLEAEINQTRAPSMVATFPLFVQPRSTNTPITDHKQRLQSFSECVKTLHLDPEYAEKKLSFSQHMQSIFKRSTLPYYSFSIIVQYPSRIQLEHQDPISFKLRTETNMKPYQTTSFLIDTPPVVTLVAAKIMLSSMTNVDCLEGSRDTVTGSQSGHWKDLSLVEWEKGSDEDGMPILNDSLADVGYSLDIGRDLSLHLSSSGVSISRSRHTSFQHPVIPTVRTRHVTHIHQLKWKLKVVCAGKECKVEGEAPVTVLGPSEETEQRKALDVGVDGVARAHRDWAGGAVSTPMLAASIAKVQNKEHR